MARVPRVQTRGRGGVSARVRVLHPAPPPAMFFSCASDLKLILPLIINPFIAWVRRSGLGVFGWPGSIAPTKAHATREPYWLGAGLSPDPVLALAAACEGGLTVPSLDLYLKLI